jgi:formate dehydrogenase subunit gamma
MSALPSPAHDPIIISENRVIRYTFRERVIHWLAGFSYLYLLLSGLAFYTPYLYWMSSLLGGGPTARFWHPWMGLLFAVVMFFMDGMWRSDMRTTEDDRRWIRAVRNYVENRDDQVPPVGRFNAGQKQFYWVMFWGAIVLLLSGLVMWFPELMPAGLYWLRGLAILIHEIAALVTIGAFIIHVYMGVFMVKGGFKAIVHGYVSARWASAHHRLWFERARRPAPER